MRSTHSDSRHKNNFHTRLGCSSVAWGNHLEIECRTVPYLNVLPSVGPRGSDQATDDVGTINI